MIDPDREKVLTELGLTSLQARVYLALANRGPSKVMTISQATGIHRTHLYEVLKSLEELGFVEKQLNTAIYTPISLKEASQSLMQSRQQEVSKLETAIKEIAERLPETNMQDHAKHEISLASNKNYCLNKALKYVENANVQIDQMHTWNRFTQLWAFFDNAYVDALARGVRIRQIVEFPSDRNQALKILSAPHFSHSLLELRFTPKTGGNMTIIDNTKVLISTSRSLENLGETPLLFSNYEGLTGLMQSYFNHSWDCATKKASADFVCLDQNRRTICQKKGN